MAKKIIDTSSYDPGTKEKPAIIKAPKKSKKPVKKKSKTKEVVVSDLDREIEEKIKKRPPYRPTVYSPKHVILGEMYLKKCIDSEIRRVKSEWETSTSWEYVVRPELPTVEGLCAYYYEHGIGVNRDTIYKWRTEEDKRDFSDMIDRIMAVQANRLQQKGLSGEYNSTIAKLILSRHGIVEKTEVEQTNVGVIWVVWLPEEKRNALEYLIASKMKK